MAAKETERLEVGVCLPCVCAAIVMVYCLGCRGGRLEGGGGGLYPIFLGWAGGWATPTPTPTTTTTAAAAAADAISTTGIAITSTSSPRTHAQPSIQTAPSRRVPPPRGPPADRPNSVARWLVVGVRARVRGHHPPLVFCPASQEGRPNDPP